MSRNRLAKLTVTDAVSTNFMISAKLLGQALQNLPGDVKFVGVFRGSYASSLIFSSDDFRETPNGTHYEDLPEIQVRFSKDMNGTPQFDYIDWSAACDGPAGRFAGIRNLPGSSGGPQSLPKSAAPFTPPKLNCYTPRYKQYVGIMDTYKYCTHCGRKESEHL